MITADFSERSTADELMDTEPVGLSELTACLADLARVNRLTLAYRPTLRFLDRVVARGIPAGRALHIVDVGSGYGDMLRRIDAWSIRRGVRVSLTGVDLNPYSREAATRATVPGRPIRWITADVFEYQPDEGIDVVVSSLFTHHLRDPMVVRFLSWMESSTRLGWFVSDLHRHAVPYHFFRHFSRLARFHRFVQHDGPVSIARAFVAADWTRLVAEARIDSGVEVHWEIPFRLTVQRHKPR